MEFKKMIFVLAITATIIFACLFGTSYAYYTYNDGTNLNVTTGDFDSGVAIIFNQSEYIDLKTGVPILSSDVDSKASKSIFSIVPDSSLLNGYDVAVTISLINISIADELKVSDFKYDLACSDGTTKTTLATGTGLDFTDDVISKNVLQLGTLSTSNNSLNIAKTYNCTFRLWLQESGENQNALMNKNFSGLVKVSSVFRK